MTLIDKAEALLPCPFCGGEAELWNANDNRPAWIACMGRCAVLISKEHATDAEAIAAWNRRAIPAADAAHVNETLKSEHDAGNVLTDAAQSRAPFFFDRYINGVRMAEDVCIERETTLEGAMQAATRIAAKGPNGEAPVLVYRAPAALTDGGKDA